ncbi:Leucine-rich repeat-containing protein 49 [Orchesella cincta]|uniref:Dynein axonemal assembly factor 1 homolog n=1 Tax=Orchesella cincta TaxID=48709 RepID=A0A1D2MEH7_ORCCI|nr:Leucine-rich repeat-containing protein 49 [Orchesella cincta]
MLPKREPELLEEQRKFRLTSCETVNSKLRALSFGRGKRAISSKSAHVTTIPLAASFASCSGEGSAECHQSIPYLPYSASSKHSRVHQISSTLRHHHHHQQQQKQQQTSLWKWKRGQSGYKSDSISCRAHSRKRSKSSSASILNRNASSSGATLSRNGESDSMPYLLPSAINSSFPATKNSSTFTSPGGKSEGKSELVTPEHRNVNPIKSQTQPSCHSASVVRCVCRATRSGTGSPEMSSSSNNGKSIKSTSSPSPSGFQLDLKSKSGTGAMVLKGERVQVTRTKEEQEKSPDSIRLDKIGLRIFPEIGGGETLSLKLLSLQHNLINRLENVPLLTQLVVLDLYDNRVERISGLQGLPSLRVLLLGKNRIINVSVSPSSPEMNRNAENLSLSSSVKYKCVQTQVIPDRSFFSHLHFSFAQEKNEMSFEHQKTAVYYVFAAVSRKLRKLNSYKAVVCKGEPQPYIFPIRIRRIEGLDGLKRLEILDLHGNQLRYVDNLGSLVALRVLNLAGNLLRNIRNLGPYGLPALTELNLKRNRIKNLEGLQKAPHLKKLLIANNDLQRAKNLYFTRVNVYGFATLAPLRKLCFLHELVVDPNPLCSASGAEYRCQALTLFPHLHTLDRCSLTDEMRSEAKLWHKRKLAEDEARKQEEARLREEMNLTVGPPGSREQIIYQARRRWESLRNYVKRSNNNNGSADDNNHNNPNASGSQALRTTLKAVVLDARSHHGKTGTSPFDQLYPPATLDLESFPNGYDQLDQMDSLLSITANNTNNNDIRKHPNNNNSIIDGMSTQADMINGSHHQPNNESTPCLQIAAQPVEAECLFDFAKSHSAPVPSSNQQTKAVPIKICKDDQEIELLTVSSNETPPELVLNGKGHTMNQGNSTTERELAVMGDMMGDKNEDRNDGMPLPCSSSFTIAQELKMIMKEKAMCPSGSSSSDAVTPSGIDVKGEMLAKQNTSSNKKKGIRGASNSAKNGSSILDALSSPKDDDEKGVEEEQATPKDAHAEDEENGKRGLEIQPSTDKSTRIAVVRPLIRVPNFDEPISHQPPNTNSSLSSPEMSSPLPQHCSSREESRSRANTNISSPQNPTLEDKKKLESGGKRIAAETSTSYFSTGDLGDVDDGESGFISNPIPITNSESIFTTDHQHHHHQSEHHQITMNGDTQMSRITNDDDDDVVDVKRNSCDQCDPNDNQEQKRSLTPVKISNSSTCANDILLTTNQSGGKIVVVNYNEFQASRLCGEGGKIIMASKFSSSQNNYQQHDHGSSSILQSDHEFSSSLSSATDQVRETKENEGKITRISSTYPPQIEEDIAFDSQDSSTKKLEKPAVKVSEYNRNENDEDVDNSFIGDTAKNGESTKENTEKVGESKFTLKQDPPIQHQQGQRVGSGNKMSKSKLLQTMRSVSFDSASNSSSSYIAGFQVGDNYDGYEEDEDQDCDEEMKLDQLTIPVSRRNSSVAATTQRLVEGEPFRRPTFPRTRSQRMKVRDRASKLQQMANTNSSMLSPRLINSSRAGGKSQISGFHPNDIPKPSSFCGKVLRRCDSATSFTTSSGGDACGSEKENKVVIPLRKQGVDFLVEVDGKCLNIFGQGAIRHSLTAFSSNSTCQVSTVKFQYVSFDSIIPYFGKLRQLYPSLEYFHFRANNLCTLAQLDALSDLQGMSALFVEEDGNPITEQDSWIHYASYRLSHWGLQIINGNESALAPLAKRLHTFHCFCCCSPSTSSDECNKPMRLDRKVRPSSPSSQQHGSFGNFCTSWDDDPILLDVIGKEALVYCPPLVHHENGEENTSINEWNTKNDKTGNGTICECDPVTGVTTSNSLFERRRLQTLGHLVNSGMEILEKVDRLENEWPSLIQEFIQKVLMDYRFVDTYMKKEYKKVQDFNLITHNVKKHSHSKQHLGP